MYQPVKDDSNNFGDDKASADFGSSSISSTMSPDVYGGGKKIVKKVRELKNVADQYNQIKMQKK